MFAGYSLQVVGHACETQFQASEKLYTHTVIILSLNCGFVIM